MGDAVKSIIGGVVIGALTVFSGGTVLGFGAVAAGSTVTIGAIAAGAIAGGVLSGALFLLKPKVPELSSEFGRELHLNGDPVAPRKIGYGQAWTSGVLRTRKQ